MASSNAEFRVIRSYEIIIVIGIILLIITGIFFYLRLIEIINQSTAQTFGRFFYIKFMNQLDV